MIHNGHAFWQRPGLLHGEPNHAVVSMQTISGQPSEKMYLQELADGHTVIWLTRHAGKCCFQWRSLPDPEVFVSHSRPKPSGKLNGCFCEMVKLFHDSSGTNTNMARLSSTFQLQKCVLQCNMEVSKKSVWASVCSVLFSFSDWLCSVKRLMTHSFEIYENFTFTLDRSLGKLWFNWQTTHELHFICDLTWFLT